LTTIDFSRFLGFFNRKRPDGFRRGDEAPLSALPLPARRVDQDHLSVEHEGVTGAVLVDEDDTTVVALLDLSHSDDATVPQVCENLVARPNLVRARQLHHETHNFLRRHYDKTKTPGKGVLGVDDVIS
jgi:hypothetical protein